MPQCAEPSATKTEKNVPFHQKNKNQINTTQSSVDSSTAWLHSPDFLLLFFHPHK